MPDDKFNPTKKAHTRGKSSATDALYRLEEGLGVVNRLSRHRRNPSVVEGQEYEMGPYQRLSSEINIPGQFHQPTAGAEVDAEEPAPLKENNRFVDTPGSVRHEQVISTWHNVRPLQELPPAFQDIDHPVRNVDQTQIDTPDDFVRRNLDKTKAIFEGMKVTVGLGPSSNIFSDSAEAPHYDGREDDMRKNALEASHRFHVNTVTDPDYDFASLARGAIEARKIFQREMDSGKRLTPAQKDEAFPEYRKNMLKGLLWAPDESEYYVRKAGALYTMSSGVGTIASQVGTPLLGLPYASAAELGSTEHFTTARELFIGRASATTGIQLGTAAYADPWLSTNAQIKLAIYTELRALGGRASRKLLTTGRLSGAIRDLEAATKAAEAMDKANTEFQKALTQGEDGSFTSDEEVDRVGRNLVNAINNAEKIMGMKQSANDGYYLNEFMKSGRSVLQGLSLLTGAITNNPFLKYGIDASIGVGSTAILPWLASSDEGRKWTNVLDNQLNSASKQMLSEKGVAIVNDDTLSDAEKVKKLEKDETCWDKSKLNNVVDGFSTPRMDRMQGINSYEKRVTHFELGALHGMEAHDWETYQKYKRMQVGLSTEYIEDDNATQVDLEKYRAMAPDIQAGKKLTAHEWDQWMTLEKENNQTLSTEEKSLLSVLEKKDKTSLMSENEFSHRDELLERKEDGELTQEEELQLTRYERRAKQSLSLDEKRLLEVLRIRSMCTPKLDKRNAIVNEKIPELKAQNKSKSDKQIAGIWQAHFDKVEELHFENNFPPVDKQEVEKIRASINEIETTLRSTFETDEKWQEYVDETHKAATGLTPSQKDIFDFFEEKVSKAKKEMNPESQGKVQDVEMKLKVITDDALLLANNWDLTSPITQERLMQILPGNSEHVDMAMADYIGTLVRKTDELFDAELMQRIGGASLTVGIGGKAGSSVIGSGLNLAKAAGGEASLLVKGVFAGAIALVGQMGAYNTSNAAVTKIADRTALQKHAQSGNPDSPFWLTKMGMFLNQAFIAPLALFKGEEKDLNTAMDDGLKALKTIDAITRAPIAKQADMTKRLSIMAASALHSQIETSPDAQAAAVQDAILNDKELEKIQAMRNRLSMSAANPNWEEQEPVETIIPEDVNKRLRALSQSSAREEITGNLRRRSTLIRQSINDAEDMRFRPSMDDTNAPTRPPSAAGSIASIASTSSDIYEGFLEDYGIKYERPSKKGKELMTSGQPLIEEEISITPEMALEDVKARLQIAQRRVETEAKSPIMGRVDNINFSQEDFDSFDRDEYLTDNAVDYVIRQNAKEINSKKVHFMNAGIAEFLKEAAPESIQQNAEMLQHEEASIILIPVHVPEMQHWELLAVDTRNPNDIKFARYDNLNRPNSEAAIKIIQQMKNIPGFENVSERNLTSYRVKSKTKAEIKTNGNCGLYVAEGALLIANAIETNSTAQLGDLTVSINEPRVRRRIQTNIEDRLEEQRGKSPKDTMNASIKTNADAVITYIEQISTPVVKNNINPEEWKKFTDELKSCLLDMNSFRNNATADQAAFSALTTRYRDINLATNAIIVAVEEGIKQLPSPNKYTKESGTAAQKFVGKMTASSDAYIEERVNTFNKKSLKEILGTYTTTQVVAHNAPPHGKLVADCEGTLVFEHPGSKTKANTIPLYMRDPDQEQAKPLTLGQRAPKEFVAKDKREELKKAKALEEKQSIGKGGGRK
ncbi:MAG: hypothetical protein V4568_08445 [Pseudomonadota bacterium]